MKNAHLARKMLERRDCVGRDTRRNAWKTLQREM